MALVHASQLNPTGSYYITGSLEVIGQTTLIQSAVSESALIVSGAIDVVQAQIQAEIQKARITIENLGSLGDRSSEDVLDLGDSFF